MEAPCGVFVSGARYLDPFYYEFMLSRFLVRQSSLYYVSIFLHTVKFCANIQV
jgi:hypothetical protein